MANLSLKRLNVDFIMLVFSTLLLNIPYWHNSLWPEHYTLVTFFNFYSFYNDFFLHHDLLRWIPYGTYGIPASFWQLHQLTPVSYAMMVIGKLVQFRNVLLLFKISILLEQLVFLSGIYLLSKTLFRSRLAVWLVCFGNLASIVWQYEHFWNLRIFYLVPFVFYFTILFFKKQNVRYFWCAALVLTLSMIGNLPYFLPLHFLLLILFSAPLAIWLGWGKTIRLLGDVSKNKFLIMGVVILFCILFFFTLHSLDGVKVFKPGRDADSFYATQEKHFLEHSAGKPVDFFEFISPTTGRQKDSTKYMGLLTWFFICLAIVSFKKIKRKRYFIAFLIPALFLIAFSLSQTFPIAKWTYLVFPPIRLFRYVGQIGALLKVFLFLLAGFGMERFFSALKSNASERIKVMREAACLAGVLLVSFPAVYAFNQKQTWFECPWPSFFWFGFGLLAVSFVVMLVIRKKSVVIVIFTVAFVLDLSAYQILVFQELSKQNKQSLPKEVYSVAPYSFPEIRHQNRNQNQDKRSFEAVSFTEPIKGLWMEGYDFAKHDPCVPGQPSIFEAASMAALTNALFKTEFPMGVHLVFMPEVMKNPAFPVMIRSMGCDRSKVRVYNEVQFAGDSIEAERLMAQNLNFHEKPILQIGKSDKIDTDESNQTETRSTIQVKNFYSNQLKLNVTLEGQQNAWLYYADAFHPGWKAFVDGKRVPIAQANIAFKAIQIKSGVHEVTFWFFDNLVSVLSYAVALIGVLAFIYLAGVFCRFLLT